MVSGAPSLRSSAQTSSASSPNTSSSAAPKAEAASTPTYYRSLPFKDITGKLTDQWKIRALTFRYFTRHILNPIALRTPRPLRILDLGAGNGWLSYRLAQMNHQPVAVDLLTNDTDGLGAAIHYKPAFFPRVQATLTQLPFEDQAFDLALFNASFHYAEDLVETLAEALRCVAPGGTVVIADSPWYKEEADGRRMIEEKRANFRSTYGFASNSIRSAEFLTPQRLAQMADALDLKWKVYKPFYGLDWALRPLRARLNRRRTPSHFRLFVAQVKI